MGRRRTIPVTTVGQFWNTLTALYGVPGSYGLAIEDIDTAVAAILVDSGTSIPTTLTAMIATINAILTDTGTDLPATLAAIVAYLDTEIAAILADTVTINWANITTIDDIVDDILADTATINWANITTIDGIVDDILVDTGTTIPGLIDAISALLTTEVADILADVTGLAGAAMRGTDSALLAANYHRFTSGLTEHGAFLGRAYTDLAQETYATLVDVTAAGYLTGLIIQVQCETASFMDLIIEIDGVEVEPFAAHAYNVGNMETTTPANCACLLTTWHADFKYVFILNPMYRFDSSFKIRLYCNHNTGPKSIGSYGSITYLTE